MSLPIPEVERELVHTRRVRYEGYRRADGLWDIEARVTDVKSRDCHLQMGVRRAGQAIHDLGLRLTIDRHFNVVAACAATDAVPYPGGCEAIVPAYGGLVGLNLLRGFRRAVRERFGGVKGCTHLSELLGGFPTAAIQTFAGELRQPEERKPFQLDQCHALESGSETVRLCYPKWYRAKATA